MKSSTNVGRPFYVTTPIYYVNDRPHIGHCYTTLIADVTARFHRLIGRDVFFLTGTDEHAEKVVQKAEDNGKTPYEWASINAERFQEAFAFMNFSNDDFVRTTEERHTTRAQEYIQELLDSGDIELGDYEGWYDPSQEEYLTEIVAKEHDYKSPVTKQPLEKRVEENYFFRLDKYEDWLREKIESDAIRVLPKARKNEVLGRLNQGLLRVPVSRRIREGSADWGIRMPGDDEHRIYVWIEALCNYVTVIDNDQLRRFWPEEEPLAFHLMAKDILWFHAVIWPAMLHALGRQPPHTVYAHAYWIAEGTKMSKSLGNFIEIDLLEAYAERYSLDAVRWFLTTQGPLGASDADFQHARFIEVYNADLANGIGNAASRVANMIGKYFDRRCPDPGDYRTWSVALEGETVDYDWPAITQAAVESARTAAGNVRVDDAAKAGIQLASKVDAFIAHTKPFSIAKAIQKGEQPEGLPAGMAPEAALAANLYMCIEALRIASLLLAPVMPEKTAELWIRWNCIHRDNPARANAAFHAPLAELAEWQGPYGVQPGQLITSGDPLFMRADPKLEPPVAGS